MKALIIAMLLLLAPAALVPTAAAEPGPCPGGGYSCSPPTICGWAPNPARDPLGYVEYWANCLR